MSVYLQFDSSARSDPYIERNLGAGLVWVPNDKYPNDPPPAAPDAYQLDKNLIQTPSNYRVFYRELNDANNVRTIGFLAHCKERPTNLNFSVESCVLVMPSNGLVPRVDDAGAVTYESILNEPYLYVRMMPINHAEGNLIYSNNPGADDATFIVWCDKLQSGTDASPPISDIVRPNPVLPVSEIDTTRWIIYKSCMITIMRLDLEAEEWQIRIYDRFGNDVVLAEDDNGGVGFNQVDPPAIDPNLQTMLLVGIKPNYPL
uniref:Uncharacterized protein n=1 Tax=Marseillevirus LCMAC201 TaxID=2506605 RepID=A0A481YVJ0_9VIRU|nr:MAG: hypothetical protein LCMAC201_00840 [Marseillevirus LCMAC201]